MTSACEFSRYTVVTTAMHFRVLALFCANAVVRATPPNNAMESLRVTIDQCPIYPVARA